MSELEETFAGQLRILRVRPVPVRELEFAKEPFGRKWRFDFAWPDYMIAVELEGGIWKRGRHQRPLGFISDTEKYNAAARLGWRVLRFTAEAVDDWSAALMIHAELKTAARLAS